LKTFGRILKEEKTLFLPLRSLKSNVIQQDEAREKENSKLRTPILSWWNRNCYNYFEGKKIFF
jgi:hypothetical protein